MATAENQALRTELTTSKRVVVKIGSRLIADDPKGRISRLCGEVARLQKQGIEVVVVSSGAIALGLLRLGWKRRPHELPRLQAAAAVGQGLLIKLYEEALHPHGLIPAQVLLTHDDVRHRGRYLSSRHALKSMLEAGVVPIVNENDTVSTAEIKFGDNDRLAALCTSLIEADALIILTDVEGLYDGDPRSGARLIEVVRNIDKDAVPVAGGATSGVGVGGMASKVEAARVAGRFGVLTVVASGRTEDPVSAVLRGAPLGTLFVPSQSRLQSRKHWIAYALRPQGRLLLDEGAVRAVRQAGGSLLPSGIVVVEGEFDAGAPVALCDRSGAEFGRGLCGYDAGAVRAISGKQSSEIEVILGYKEMDEVIHRDDLVLL